MKLKNFIIGLCMGACDMVPGVSGGTIAFISGIYEQLLSSIKNCLHVSSYKILFSGNISGFRKHIHGNFLITLFTGIIISVLLMSHFIESLLIDSPHLVFGFFLGLVLASIFVLFLNHKRNFSGIILLLLGAIVAFGITTFSTSQGSEQRRYIILGGSVAISAMILPGISGSFILLLLGLYGPILSAINNFDILTIGLFVSGVIIGLAVFSHTISYVFKRYHYQTISLLIGFMIGALPILWPWQNGHLKIENNINEKNDFKLVNVLPENYERESQTFFVVFLFLLSGGLGFLTFQHLNRD